MQFPEIFALDHMLLKNIDAFKLVDISRLNKINLALPKEIGGLVMKYTPPSTQVL